MARLKLVLVVVLAVALGAGAWLLTRRDGGSGGATPLPSLAKVEKMMPKAVAETMAKVLPGPDQDRPVRCQIGDVERLMRGLDCQQQGGLVTGDGSTGGYSKVTAEEQRAAVAPTVARKKPGPEEKKAD